MSHKELATERTQTRHDVKAADRTQANRQSWSDHVSDLNNMDTGDQKKIQQTLTFWTYPLMTRRIVSSLLTWCPLSQHPCNLSRPKQRRRLSLLNDFLSLEVVAAWEKSSVRKFFFSRRPWALFSCSADVGKSQKKRSTSGR